MRCTTPGFIVGLLRSHPNNFHQPQTVFNIKARGRANRKQIVAFSCALRRDKLDGSATVSGRINNPGKLTLPFPAKTVVAVYPTIGLDFGEPFRMLWCPHHTCRAKERSTFQVLVHTPLGSCASLNGVLFATSPRSFSCEAQLTSVDSI